MGFVINLHSVVPNQQLEATQVKKVIDMINEKIKPFDQKITVYEYGLTNDEFYVFHSTAKTSSSKFQNTYTIDELDFFKLILTKIVENEGLTISPMNALTLCNLTPGKINKLRAQKLLDIWIQNHYLYKHTDSQIYLGAKLLTEFKELLQGMQLNHIKSCSLCECIAIWVILSLSNFDNIILNFSFLGRSLRKL